MSLLHDSQLKLVYNLFNSRFLNISESDLKTYSVEETISG